MKTETKILICYNAPVSIFPVYNGKPLRDEVEETDLSEKSFLSELNIIKESIKNKISDNNRIHCLRNKYISF